MEVTTPKWLLPNPHYWQTFQRKPERMRGRYFSLMSMHCREHYHWLHDVLTRLHRVLEHLPEDIRFIVPKDLAEDRLAFLLAIGIKRERLVEYDQAVPLELEELWFAPLSAPHRFDDPEAVAWLRQHLRRIYTLDPQPVNRLYVSRSQAATRRLVNEEELLPLLREQGFRIIHAENMSLAEQAIEFSQASVIFGVHGAGFTNILFAPQSARLAEIFPASVGFRTYYWSLSHAAGMDYGYVKGVPVEPANDNSDISLPRTVAEWPFLRTD
jgi:capsular polysaccharide biosynthesis protein